MLTRRQFMGTASSVTALSLFDKGGIAQTVKPVSDAVIAPYQGPAGGWAAVRAVATHLGREDVEFSGSELLWVQNKPEGFKCVSCAWAKPADHHPFEFCENGAKATLWEATGHRIGPEFFAKHTCTALENWADHDLEKQGRLTHPLRWDKASDKYVPVEWDQAFAEIGRELKAADPKQAVFYTSGRAALETSYMFQLFARMYGHNNLPDSSNMCHEGTSVGLPESIGAPVGTGTLEDFKHCDLIFTIGQNAGVNSPRILHEYQRVRDRGAPFIVFNPLRERGLERFTNPQRPLQMLTLSETKIATQYHLMKVGGDIPALTGVCKAVIALDDGARAAGTERALDTEFIEEHTHGFEAFAAHCRAQSWDSIEEGSGLSRADLEAAAETYVKSKACLGIYGMGVTQQVTGVQNVQMVANLLLLRGNIGKPGGNIIPVRGHSNVQGQRTVGITEKPELAPLDKFAEQYGFVPPRDKGMDTAEVCEAVLAGKLQAFVALGGNFIRAVPDTVAMEEAWRKIPLTVQIATKLNRSHLIHGETAYLLPCLGRTEIDKQASGPQAVTVEDSTAHFHGSKGYADPASPHLLSEPKIVAELAKATLAPNGKVPWDEWVGDYAKVRHAMEETWPEVFKNFNERIWTPGGVERPIAARQRKWETKTGRANFLVPAEPRADPRSAVREGGDVLRLTTLRSNGQFNTTVYEYADRYRGVEGTRRVVFMNVDDIRRLGLTKGDTVNLTTAFADNVQRSVKGFEVVPYPIAAGCIAAYFPEATPLIPLWHRDESSHTPSYKILPVRVSKSGNQRDNYPAGP
jgi:molybdopterin-dependent oxidoreductase alpha subunit